MKTSKGFTLVEMAIVLLIVGLLMGGLMMPLASQMEQKRISETSQILEQIKEALIGFAATNGRLPRPATNANNGIENPAPCANEAACTGLIPWATLGILQLDGWNKIIRYSVTPAFANAPIILTTIPTKSVQTRNAAGALVFQAGQAACAAITQGCVPAVIYSHGNANFGTTAAGIAIPNGSGGTNADEIANNTGPTNFINRTLNTNTLATGGEFDDIVVWIPHGVLVNRMLSAGALP